MCTVSRLSYTFLFFHGLNTDMVCITQNTLYATARQASYSTRKPIVKIIRLVRAEQIDGVLRTH